MKNEIIVPFLTGTATFRSELSLEEVGEILSEHIFGGLKFGGRDLEIHDEVPTIFIPFSLLGFEITLEGYSGFGEEQFFNLSIFPKDDMNYNLTVKIDNYITGLLKDKLKHIPEIEIIDDEV